MPKSLVVLAPADTAACCPPLSAQPLSQAQAEQVAPLLKALADPVRLAADVPGGLPSVGVACVCDLNEAFDLSQPTISHHLKVLHEAGLLDREQRGVCVCYRARPEALASLDTLIGSPEPAPRAGSGPARCLRRGASLSPCGRASPAG